MMLSTAAPAGDPVMPLNLTPERLSRPVDLVHLSRHTFGDRELEREVLALFLRQSRQCMARLRGEAAAEARRSVAHTIKGSARGIGAWRVAEIAGEVEARADAGPTLAPLVDELDRAIGDTNGFIEGLLRG